MNHIDKNIKKAYLYIIYQTWTGYIIDINSKEDAYKLLKLLDDKDQIIKFEILKPNLNDIFIEKVGGTNND